MRLLKLAAMAAALSLFAMPLLQPAAAFAQDVVQAVTEVPAETTMLQQILVVALPALFGVLSLVSVLIYAEIKRRFGIDIEAKHREALQSALENGIRWALVQAGWIKDTPVPDNLVKMATGYVASSVPDALKQFKIDPGSAAGKAMLERLLVPHLPIGAEVSARLVGRVAK